MSKLIVIIGVTGAQGSSVAKTFLTLPGWNVRGITRNPLSKTSQSLSSLGVEIVAGDLDSPSTLIPAFAGAHTIFANTDFFTHLFAAISSPVLASSVDGNAKKYAHDREVQQGVNIAEVAASTAVLSTLERFIYSTLPGASELSKGKHSEVYHFDSKVAVLRIIKERFPELEKKLSLLQMGHYVENWRAFHPLAPMKGVDGSWVMRRQTGEEFKWDWVVAEKDTGSFVEALVGLPCGTRMLGVSEVLTGPEFAAIWGKVHGVEVRYKKVPRDEFWVGIPPAMGEEIGDSFSFIEEFGWCGALTPAQLGVEVKVTSVEEYIRGEDWSPILKA